MGSGISKPKKNLHDTAFKLLDKNNDEKIYKNEINLLANWFHTNSVINSAQKHTILINKEPEKFLYEKLDIMYGKPLDKKLFNKLACMIPDKEWESQLLPILKGEAKFIMQNPK